MGDWVAVVGVGPGLIEASVSDFEGALVLGHEEMLFGIESISVPRTRVNSVVKLVSFIDP